MPEIIEIRIKRLRTPTKDSVPEILEKWALREGLTIPGAVLHLVSTHPVFREYLKEVRKHG